MVNVMNQNFNQQDFETLVNEFINETSSNILSNRTKISKLRQYCEVIARKILDLPNNKPLMLGQAMSKLETHSNKNPLLMKSITFIKDMGNKCTHTQNAQQKISDEDFKACMENLLNVYAYLFIAYFERYRFGSSNQVLSLFSLLPPILRHIVLDYLFLTDSKNFHIIDKLSLVKLKAIGEDEARTWLNSNKSFFEQLLFSSIEGNKYLQQRYQPEEAMQIKDMLQNMYNLCFYKVQTISDILEKQGRLYRTFEEALPIFIEEKEKVPKTTEIIEFLDIMDFIYLQRTPVDNNQLERLASYQTMLFKG